MSANRIVRRRAWRANPTTNGKPVAYHDRCIANGERHPSFQRRIRTARAAMGYRRPTTDMHHFEGKRY